MTNSTEIWVVDDDSSIRWVIEKALSGEDIPSKTFECADDLLAALETHTPKAIISDIRMPGMDGLALLEELKTIIPDVPVIITTAHSDLDSGHLLRVRRVRVPAKALRHRRDVGRGVTRPCAHQQAARE